MPRPRILVDDEPDVQVCADLLRLRRPHLRVLEAHGQEEVLAADRPHVVLTDYRMPGGDGLALAAAHRPPLSPPAGGSPPPRLDPPPSGGRGPRWDRPGGQPQHEGGAPALRERLGGAAVLAGEARE